MAIADAQLVSRTLSGDLESYGELHRRYFARLVRVAMRVLPDRERAEDVAQDAYAAALKTLPRLVNAERFYPWLCRIAVNLAIEETRRTRRKAKLHLAWAGEGGGEAAPGRPRPTVLDGMLESEKAETVRAALDSLPDKQRAAVVLRYYDDLPMREVAEVLECREVTARSHLFRGLRRLGSLLGEAGEEST